MSVQRGGRDPPGFLHSLAVRALVVCEATIMGSCRAHSHSPLTRASGVASVLSPSWEQVQPFWLWAGARETLCTGAST